MRAKQQKKEKVPDHGNVDAKRAMEARALNAKKDTEVYVDPTRGTGPTLEAGLGKAENKLKKGTRQTRKKKMTRLGRDALVAMRGERE